MISLSIGVAALVIWIYLLSARGRFWRCSELLPPAAATENDRGRQSPSVAAIVPARDEAETIGKTVASLLNQDYPGELEVTVVDDESGDGTAAAARAAAGADADRLRRLAVLAGAPPPPGWTGKIWAMQQGLAAVLSQGTEPQYLLFVDADIVLAPDLVRRLVSLAEARGAAMASVMVKLNCGSFAERQFVPAFVFFFQMLYPFAWVSDPRRGTAAAAGGCMIVRREALSGAGGLEAIKGALIDDCALGAVMKHVGPIWLGLTADAWSLRVYRTVSDFGRMVARSAFAELRFSSIRLVAAIAGLALVFVAPPLLAIFADGYARVAGALAWVMMALAYAPTLKFYRRPAATGLGLPLVAVAYAAFTLLSAANTWRGRGGLWKGRFQAPMAKAGRA
jgi:hopene-associated glycosyltransferase HpnB